MDSGLKPATKSVVTYLVVLAVVVAVGCQTTSQTKVGDLCGQTVGDQHVTSGQITVNDLPHTQQTTRL